VNPNTSQILGRKTISCEDGLVPCCCVSEYRRRAAATIEVDFTYRPNDNTKLRLPFLFKFRYLNFLYTLVSALTLSTFSSCFSRKEISGLLKQRLAVMMMMRVQMMKSLQRATHH
jgi:hypothetical protein